MWRRCRPLVDANLSKPAVLGLVVLFRRSAVDDAPAVEMCIGMCIDMCMSTCIHTWMGMYTDRRNRHMHCGMCMWHVPFTCGIGMCIDVCIDMCIGHVHMYAHVHVHSHVHRHVYRHVCRHAYRHVHRHVHRRVHRYVHRACVRVCTCSYVFTCAQTCV